MKKIILSLFVLGFFFGACNQNEDLDVNETSIQEKSKKKMLG